jgi:hypothetical protein
MSTPLQSPRMTYQEGHWRGEWEDGYTLIVKDLDATRTGFYRTVLDVEHHGAYVLTLSVDLLNTTSREQFAITIGARNGVAPVVWDDRLVHFYRNLQHALTPTAEQSPWAQAQTAEAFLAHEEEDLQEDARDLLVMGCVTLVAAPAASGKTLVALYLAVALAQGGVFRGQQLPTRRVLLVDRDNPPALIKKRLRWLGAHKVTNLKVLTRNQAPPLTDADAWAAFPAQDYDVVIVDSIGAATEGVSEKEGKQTQQYLAILKDLAQRGLAVLALDNTNKAAQNYRGRGEKRDAVDILYEVRNITGWTPSHAGDWWEDLPDFGEHTWQQRATRRKGQAVLQIAFIPSKFRGGMDPEPFVLAIDTTQDPWTLDDITEDIANAGARAAEETARVDRAKIAAAESALVQALHSHPPGKPMLKSEAEVFLCAQGLRQKVARTLLISGGNRDIYPAGQWVLRPIPGARGTAIGVYPTGEEDHNKNNNDKNTPTSDAGCGSSISVDGSTPSDEKTVPCTARKYAGETGTVFSSWPRYDTTKIDTADDVHLSASADTGFFVVTDSPSSEDACIHEHVDDLNVCNDCCEILPLVEED